MLAAPFPFTCGLPLTESRKKFQSAGRSTSRWRPKANRAAGTKEESRTLNSYLETLVRNIEDVHTALVKENAVITAESLKMRFLGQDTKDIT